VRLFGTSVILKVNLVGDSFYKNRDYFQYFEGNIGTGTWQHWVCSWSI